MSISPYVQGMSGASAEQAGQNARPAEAYRNNALRTATSSQPPNAQGSASEAYASDVNALAGVFSNAAATINSSTASPSQQVDALLSVVMTVLDAQSTSSIAPTVQGLGGAFFQATQGSPLMKAAISLIARNVRRGIERPFDSTSYSAVETRKYRNAGSFFRCGYGKKYVFH